MALSEDPEVQMTKDLQKSFDEIRNNRTKRSRDEDPEVQMSRITQESFNEIRSSADYEKPTTTYSNFSVPPSGSNVTDQLKKVYDKAREDNNRYIDTTPRPVTYDPGASGEPTDDASFQKQVENTQRAAAIIGAKAPIVIDINDQNLPQEISPDVLQLQQERFNNNFQQLPDGNYVNRTLLRQLENESPALYRALVDHGFERYDQVLATYNKAMTSYQNAYNAIDKYVTKDDNDKNIGVDIAKYLRDNPGDETTLKVAGFSSSDIKEAEDYNRLYYGVGAPDYVPLDKFTEKYIAEHGGDPNLHRGTATDKEVAEYDKLMREARKEHEQLYKTEMSLDQWAALYFDDKGWDFDIHRGTATDKEIQQYDNHLREATAKFTEKYGTRYLLEKGGEKVAKMVESTVPVWYTARYWDEMTTGERIFSVATDAVSIAFILTGASAAVRGGASVKAALSRAVIDELKAPFVAVAHPIKTLKGTAMAIYDPLETLIRGHKIPLAAAETAYSTVRIPLGQVDLSPSDLKTLRDALTAAAVRGDIPLSQVDDVIGELRLSAMQKVKPIAVHATPDVRPFLEGIDIQAGREGGLFLAPNLHSRFTYSSAFGDVPADGIRGAIVVNDPDILARLTSSNKLYKSPSGTVAEIESVLQAGESLPPPSQVLMTRDLNGDKLTLLVFGQPYSASELAKLKIMGSVDTVTDVFKSPLTLSDAGDNYADLMKMKVNAQDIAEQLKVAQKAGKVDDVARLAGELDNLNVRIDRAAVGVETAYRTTTPMRILGTYSSSNFLVNDGEAIRKPDQKDVLPRDTALLDTSESARKEDASREIERIKERAERQPGTTVKPATRTDVGDDEDTEQRETRDDTDNEAPVRIEPTEPEPERTDDERDDREREAPPPERVVRTSPARNETDRTEPDREPPEREAPDRTDPFRDIPDRDDPFRDEPDRDDPFRDEPDRDDPFRDEPDREPPERNEPERDEPDRVPPSRPPRRDDDKTDEPPPDKSKRKSPKLESKQEKPESYKGAVAWKQGIGWWVFLPPYNRPEDRIFVKKKPEGATIVEDAKSAVSTIQAIGGEAPIDEKFDMGIMDVYLNDPPRKPSRKSGRSAIKFKPDKDGTYGGTRSNSRKVGPYYYKNGAVSRKPM